MWGDPEAAVSLEARDPLAAVLFQACGPAHVPLGDPRWQELLHGYNVWVHVEESISIPASSTAAVSQQDAAGASATSVAASAAATPGGRVVHQACSSLVHHAPRTSNLAALALHVSRQLNELTAELAIAANPSGSANGGGPSGGGAVNDFSSRIARVGKARAVAGSLHLLRIMAHSVIVHSAAASLVSENNKRYLAECFTYRSRDQHAQQRYVDASAELLYSLLAFLASNPLQQQRISTAAASMSVQQAAAASHPAPTAASMTVNQVLPEMYDAALLVLELILVLLSTQLYEPMLSSFQRHAHEQEDGLHNGGQGHRNRHSSEDLDDDGAINVFWRTIMKYQGNEKSSTASDLSTPRVLLRTLLEWAADRPASPDKSLAHHHQILLQSIALQAKGETSSVKVGPDGMYESAHAVVNACAPAATSHSTVSTSSASAPASTALVASRRHSSANLILDATKGVLILGTTIIWLPFRLMSLALGLLGHHHGAGGGKDRTYEQAHRRMLQRGGGTGANANALTKDVLWLSESPVADLASCLLLLLIHNERCGSALGNSLRNPFRDELASLSDNRWEQDDAEFLPGVEGGVDLPDLPPLPAGSDGGDDSGDGLAVTPLLAGEEVRPPNSHRRTSSQRRQPDALTFNFEQLFTAFGRTAHSEVGSVLLYTLMQTSKAFNDSVSVRSDLDTIVLPLLRTLYFGSAARHYAAQDFASRGARQADRPARRNSNDSASSHSTSASHSTSVLSIRNCPFRSQSQLYVIIILLLLFSQDPSFGTDAFRRVHVSNVHWYKERYLKEINLGSILLLCILRSLTFNLNRLRDAFLLSNCCAVLMNLGPSMTDLHEYAAMRLVSVTLSSMRHYLVLRAKHPEDDDANGTGNDDDAELLSTPTAMHGEVARTLLSVLKQSVSSKNVDRNLNLVYALVYHQAEWKKQTSLKGSPFKKSETERIGQVIAAASAVIEDGGAARTAAKALKVLSDNMDRIQQAGADKRPSKRDNADVFTFTYEEESDPESFFVPYVWEVVVCAATASLMEWVKPRILVFPLLEEPTAEAAGEENGPGNVVDSSSMQALVDRNFSNDVSDVV